MSMDMDRDGRDALPSSGRPNRLGIAGWLGGGRWGFERYLYTLHRVTGLGLLLYFIAHIVVTSRRAFGPEIWRQTMASVSGPVFSLAEYLVFAAFALHGLNGIRLILVELGFAVGKPIEPVYPYKTSVGFQRPLAIGAMLLGAIIMAAGGLDFYVLH
jgi:succinate dehydrogenase / fumarate reductase, cytochrome b subunit